MANTFIKNILQNGTDNVVIQLFRYAIVGGVAFAVDFGALYCFTDIVGVPYLLSACIGFCLGLVVNYLLSVKWVFNQDDPNRNSVTELIGWFVIGIAGLGLNTLIMWIATDIFNVYYLISKIISTVIVFLWNFFARRYLISKL